MTRPRASFARLAEGEEEQSVCLSFPPDEAARAEALAREQGWVDAADEGNWALAVVAVGLAAIRAEQRVVGVDTSDSDARDRLRDRLRRERMALDGRVAPRRFAAFELGRSNRILEIKHTALRVDNHGMRLRLGEDAP